MKITFYAHASFRLEADGLAVITDPYTPGPQGSDLELMPDSLPATPQIYLLEQSR